MSVEASSLDSQRKVLGASCLEPTIGQGEIDFLNKHGILQRLERERVRVKAPAFLSQLTFASKEQYGRPAKSDRLEGFKSSEPTFLSFDQHFLSARKGVFVGKEAMPQQPSFINYNSSSMRAEQPEL